MKAERVIDFLKLFGVTNGSASKRSKWVVSSCPLQAWSHEGGKSGLEVFGVRVEQGDPRANCFACGWHGRLGDLLLEARAKNKIAPRLTVAWGTAAALLDEASSDAQLDLSGPDIEEMLFGPKEELHEFPEWWLASFPPVAGIAWAESYLAARGVTAKTALALDLRADTKQRRICFPVRDFAGVLCGLHGRAVDPAVDPRYRMYLQAGRNNPIVWLGEHWVDLTRPIVVVEGPFDVASVMRVYDNVVSPLFANPSLDKIKRMSDALEQITLFDVGKGGDAGRGKWTASLGKTHLITHLRPPDGRKDPGEMSIEEVAETLEPYVSLTG